MRGEWKTPRSFDVALSRTSSLVRWALVLGLAVVGCKTPAPLPPRPNVSPHQRVDQTGALALSLDASDVMPMYTELLAIDLSTVVRVAGLQNIEIRQAQESVEASRGGYESAVGSIFPAIVPTALFEHVEGSVRATPGNIVGVGFNTFQPSIAIQWIVNPGRVYYDVLAAKKQLRATQQFQRGVILETLRRGSVQYYDLVHRQAKVATADKGVEEAQELVRVNRIRIENQMGVRADLLRAQARLAGRRQDLVLALHAFRQASIALCLTLHLDPTVTLVPSIDTLPATHLVRDDLSIEVLLDIAVTFRPDLAEVRTLVEVLAAKAGSTWWGAWGPQFEVGYQYGGITGHSNNTAGGDGIPGNLIVNPSSSGGSFSSNPVVNGLIKEGISRGSKKLDRRRDESFGFSDQQRFRAGVGWRLSLAAFGDLKTAKAVGRHAALAAEAQLNRVQAEVVFAQQTSRTNRQLITLANEQLKSAEEALRLMQAKLGAGAATTLDVLQSQDAATQARLRYTDAIVGYNQAQINLLAALGLLDPGALLEESEEGA